MPSPHLALLARAHAWWVFAACGLGLVATHRVASPDRVRLLLELVVGLLAALAVHAGARWHRTHAPRPWRVMSCGLLLAVLAQLLDSLDGLENLYVAPVGGLCRVASYALLGLGLFTLVRPRHSRADRARLFDGLTVAAALALVSTVTLVLPSHAAGVGVAVPVGDLMLLTGLMRLVVTPGWKRPATRLLGLAVVLLLATDTATTVLELRSSAPSALLELLRLGAYVAWGAAALHPTMQRVAEPTREVVPTFGKRRLVAAAAAATLGPATLAVQQLLGLPLDVWPAVTGSLVLFGLVVARMALAIEQIATVNQQAQELQDQLAFEATHDSLTLLPNRAHGLVLTTAALQGAQRTGARTALLFIDLDGFKQVNDSYGHSTGDQVLRRVAERLNASLRGTDVAIRLGGDEFVVLLHDVESAEAALAVAERLVVRISVTMQLPSGRARVGASVGVAFDIGGVSEAEALLHEADAAAYAAKSAGKGRAQLYDDSMRDEASERAEVEDILRRAIADDELVLHYQPILHARTGEIEGYEALVRWDRPGEGLILPEQFLPLAHSSELISEVDAWVVEHAAHQLAQWTTSFAAPDLFVSVDVSAQYAARSRIVRDVREVLESTGVAPAQLVLELHESVLRDEDRSVPHLRQLRELGVSISIDDFGAGFHDLATLAELPVDSVKIDGHFLDLDASMSGKLLPLMLQGAAAVGLTTVAQGIEHDHQLTQLRDLDCGSVQGFALGRPMSATEAEVYHQGRLGDRFQALTLLPPVAAEAGAESGAERRLA